MRTKDVTDVQPRSRDAFNMFFTPNPSFLPLDWTLSRVVSELSGDQLSA